MDGLGLSGTDRKPREAHGNYLFCTPPVAERKGAAALNCWAAVTFMDATNHYGTVQHSHSTSPASASTTRPLRGHGEPYWQQLNGTGSRGACCRRELVVMMQVCHEVPWPDWHNVMYLPPIVMDCAGYHQHRGTSLRKYCSNIALVPSAISWLDSGEILFHCRRINMQ